MKLFQSIVANVRALGDNAAWIFIILGAAILGVADWDTLVMLTKWSGFAFLAAGATIWISRITFREIKLSDLMAEVKLENTAAAIVAAALICFCAVVFIGLLAWAK